MAPYTIPSDKHPTSYRRRPAGMGSTNGSCIVTHACLDKGARDTDAGTAGEGFGVLSGRHQKETRRAEEGEVISMYPDEYPSLYWLPGRCRWFPWLPRWWWSGMYGPVTPYATIPKEQEIAMLEDQARLLKQAIEQIKKRLDELKK